MSSVEKKKSQMKIKLWRLCDNNRVTNCIGFVTIFWSQNVIDQWLIYGNNLWQICDDFVVTICGKLVTVSSVTNCVFSVTIWLSSQLVTNCYCC